eukprot:gene13128-3450_t
MSLKGVCQNPYADVCYASTEEDERVRKNLQIDMSTCVGRDMHVRRRKQMGVPKGKRFPVKVTNGNLQAAIPDIVDQAVRTKLPAFYQVDTNTRTIFQNETEKYDPHGATIAEQVQSLHFPSNGMKLTGHKAMNLMAPKDPRQQNCRPAHRPEVGPGFYREDPLGDKTTALANIQPGTSHHMTRFSKDPSRSSPAFKSPERGTMASDMKGQSLTDGMVFLPQDYSSWTEKGFAQSTQLRVIETERWGKTVRDKLPKAKDRSQTVYEPTVTCDGHGNSTAAYVGSRDSMRYKQVFESAMPRLMATGGGHNEDPRHTRTYSLEPPLYKSFNSAYEGAANYTSLASKASHSAPMSSSLPDASSFEPAEWFRPTSSNAQQTQQADPEDRSAPQQAASTSEDVDWRLHQYLANGGDGGMARHQHRRAPSALGYSSPVQQDDDGVGISGAGYADHGMEAPLPFLESTYVSDGGMVAGYWSAPSTPVQPYPPAKNGGRFGTLGFLRRATPYKSLIQSALRVSKDLQQARHAVRSEN